MPIIRDVLFSRFGSAFRSTNGVTFLIPTKQQIFLRVTHSNALTFLDVINAFQSRIRFNTCFGSTRSRHDFARARRVFEHVTQHLAVKAAVNVQRFLEQHRGMAETREICGEIGGDLLDVPRVADDVVNHPVVGVTFSTVAVKGVVVRVAAKNHHETGRDEVAWNGI